MKEIHGAPSAVTVEAHAKINLTLDVTGRRDDGYHLVEMVMQSVALHDDVHAAVTREGEGRGIVLSCDAPGLPVDGSNLAYRAAALFYRETGVPLHTCEIDIAKRIPLAAGLAGGSADAAAVLRALDRLHGTGLDDAALCAMGVKLGADVPFCLLGGTMLAGGIGERLTRLPPAPACWVVLCRPPVAVSTAAVYAQMDAAVVPVHPDTQGMLHALGRGDFAGVCARLANVMEEVTGAWHPAVGEIIQAMRESGADGARMSGSGPTVYGLFREEARARDAWELLSARFADTFLTVIE